MNTKEDLLSLEEVLLEASLEWERECQTKFGLYMHGACSWVSIEEDIFKFRLLIESARFHITQLDR